MCPPTPARTGSETPQPSCSLPALLPHAGCPGEQQRGRYVTGAGRPGFKGSSFTNRPQKSHRPSPFLSRMARDCLDRWQIEDGEAAEGASLYSSRLLTPHLATNTAGTQIQVSRRCFGRTRPCCGHSPNQIFSRTISSTFTDLYMCMYIYIDMHIN